jgi:hypothetical protein
MVIPDLGQARKKCMPMNLKKITCEITILGIQARKCGEYAIDCEISLCIQKTNENRLRAAKKGSVCCGVGHDHMAKPMPKIAAPYHLAQRKKRET